MNNGGKNFFIGPIGDGLRADARPWAIPEDSWTTMLNCYQWRGRIVKRQGYTKLGVLANGTPVMGLKTKEDFGINTQTLVAFDTTSSYEYNGTNFVPLPSVMNVTWSGTDYNFFWTTNYANAFWATNNKPGLNGWAVQNFTAQAGTGTSATVNVTAAGNTAAINDFVYFLNITGPPAANNLISAKVTAIVVPGSIFTVMVVNPPTAAFMFTNGVPLTGLVMDANQNVPNQDGIRYYGILSNGTGWANYNPPVDPNNALAGALMIFPYRGYLVFLSTWEGNDLSVDNFGNRARWTQIGTPYYSAPQPVFPNVQGIDANAARDDLFGRGGANDAPTDEVIVTAGFIRDILVVYFERSTWRLRFVNNSQNPFVWERVNVELGSDCTFSVIPFDKGLMSIGNRGITISDGNDTSRFDEKIPNTIFDIRQDNFGLQRVYGIRTFRTKLNYWTFPSLNSANSTYPDQVLVFNYETKNWSFFDDSFTCFGYFYESDAQETWADLTDPWSSYSDLAWNSGVSQLGYESIVAGNQQGYVFELEQTTGVNDPSLAISNITSSDGAAIFTSNNHNLLDGNWIKLTGITGTTYDDGNNLNGHNFMVNNSSQSETTFGLSEYQHIDAGPATGAIYTYTISYQNILPGSIQIIIGALNFTDPQLNGVLVEASGLGNGTIVYTTGIINLNFTPSIATTEVYIWVVSLDPLQPLTPINTTGVYGGSGEITRINGYDLQSKFFNFFGADQRARLSKIDFYMNSTATGQVTCNIFADSSNVAANVPLPDNAFSNVVVTSPSPYQIGQGPQLVYRLYSDVLAQTFQIELTLTNAQLAVDAYNSMDIELLAMMINSRPGGRII